jgi:hypothetical protein
MAAIAVRWQPLLNSQPSQVGRHPEGTALLDAAPHAGTAQVACVPAVHWLEVFTSA